MTVARLSLTRPEILAFRRHAGGLDERLPRGADSPRRAAWAGLQDSMPRAARLELARRYLHVYGPATPEAFGRWAEIGRRGGVAAFEALGDSLTPVGTPVGDAWILASDEVAFRATPGPAASARLLPSGDAYFLLHGAERDLLIPDASRRDALWTPRVWPGALLVGGEITGTWRRAGAVLTVQPWRRLSPAERDAVTAEAGSLPLPGTRTRATVRWDDVLSTMRSVRPARLITVGTRRERSTIE